MRLTPKAMFSRLKLWTDKFDPAKRAMKEQRREENELRYLENKAARGQHATKRRIALQVDRKKGKIEEYQRRYAKHQRIDEILVTEEKPKAAGSSEHYRIYQDNRRPWETGLLSIPRNIFFIVSGFFLLSMLGTGLGVIFIIIHQIIFFPLFYVVLFLSGSFTPSLSEFADVGGDYYVPLWVAPAVLVYFLIHVGIYRAFERIEKRLPQWLREYFITEEFTGF